jgi:hypothetical protein
MSEPFAFAPIARPATAASSEFAFAIVAVAWVITPTGIEIHVRLLPEMLV